MMEAVYIITVLVSLFSFMFAIAVYSEKQETKRTKMFCDTISKAIIQGIKEAYENEYRKTRNDE